jgi:predicted dehydrogenase
MVNVGLIGIGAIGRMHFDCWRKSPYAKVIAIASRDPRKRAGDWKGAEFNLGNQAASQVDLAGVTAYAEAAELIADPAVQIVDICTSTPHHARIASAALCAGKDVVCEKPMALSAEECRAMEDAAATSGRQLMVAHCLRYWPHYVKAKELLASGAHGKAVYAQFQRSAGAPVWSADGWLMKPEESGGVLDMQIHDIDVALWWFGKPQSIETRGWFRDRVPMILDANWTYANGPLVQLHGAWDPNGGEFRHGFRLVMEEATLVYDLEVKPGVLQLHHKGKTSELAMEEPSAHQAELDDFARCVSENQPFTRFTPTDSRLAVELGLEELRQCRG